jgi:hypothetical protein
MKYALAPLPDTPGGGVTAGIDWASEDHASWALPVRS